MAKRGGVTDKEFLKSLEGLRFPGLQENKDLLGSTTPELLKVAKELSHVMLENKLLSRPVSLENIFVQQ
jgi:hypothetical protein